MLIVLIKCVGRKIENRWSCCTTMNGYNCDVELNSLASDFRTIRIIDEEDSMRSLANDLKTIHIVDENPSTTATSTTPTYYCRCGLQWNATCRSQCTFGGTYTLDTTLLGRNVATNRLLARTMMKPYESPHGLIDINKPNAHTYGSPKTIIKVI